MLELGGGGYLLALSHQGSNSGTVICPYLETIVGFISFNNQY